jgi:protein-S-isoprenylcysteine O-methyltransferase Ste14
MVRRLSIFAYGVVSYGIFFASFLYAIGFVGGFGVPRIIDGPLEGSLVGAIAVDLGLLGLFALQHSVMARQGFKRRLTRIVPEPAERSTYVLASSVALLLLFWQWRPIGGVVWSVESSVAQVVLYGVFAVGWATILVCTFLINHFDLFGLRQVWLALLDRPYTSLRFTTPGPYRVVRHPLYVGWLLAFWATPLIVNTVSVVVTPAFSLRITAYGQLPVGVCLYTGLGVIVATTREPDAGRVTPTVALPEEPLYNGSPL